MGRGTTKTPPTMIGQNQLRQPQTLGICYGYASGESRPIYQHCTLGGPHRFGGVDPCRSNEEEARGVSERPSTCRGRLAPVKHTFRMYQRCDHHGAALVTLHVARIVQYALVVAVCDIVPSACASPRHRSAGGARPRPPRATHRDCTASFML
jgi:hypothetical protein